MAGLASGSPARVRVSRASCSCRAAHDTSTACPCACGDAATFQPRGSRAADAASLRPRCGVRHGLRPENPSQGADGRLIVERGRHSRIARSGPCRAVRNELELHGERVGGADLVGSGRGGLPVGPVSDAAARALDRGATYAKTPRFQFRRDPARARERRAPGRRRLAGARSAVDPGPAGRPHLTGPSPAQPSQARTGALNPRAGTGSRRRGPAASRARSSPALRAPRNRGG